MTDRTKVTLLDINATGESEGNALVIDGSGGIVASGVAGAVEVQEDDAQKVTNATVLNFEGDVTVTDEGAGKATVNISGGGGGSLEVQEDDVQTVTDVTVLNFEGGADVTDDGSGKATITVSGAGAADFNIWMPEAPPASPSAYDDEFDDSSFDTSLWTEFDVPGNMTPNEAEYGFYMTGGTSNNFQGIFQEVPDQDFAIYTKLDWLNNSDGDNQAGLLVLQDAGALSTTDLYGHANFRGGVLGFRGLRATQYNAAPTEVWNRVGGPGGWEPGYWMRFRQVGSAWDFGYSTDGKNWFDFDNGHTEDFTVDAVGLFQRRQNPSDTNNKVIFSFFRYTTNAAVTDTLYGDRVSMWRA